MSLEHFQTEMMIFGLHCLDRATFAHRGAEYRARLMDGAFSFARMALATQISEQHRDDFVDHLDRLYNIRQGQYGAWKLPTKDSPKGTLFWEFAKQVCEDAQVYNPASVVALSEAAFAIFRMMSELVERTLP